MSSVITTRNQEIITVLCGLRLSLTDLLVILQNTYPDASWTSSLLSSFLTAGVKQGRFCSLPTSSGATHYQVRSDMVKVNPSNKIYATACSAVQDFAFCGTNAGI